MHRNGTFWRFSFFLKSVSVCLCMWAHFTRWPEEGIRPLGVGGSYELPCVVLGAWLGSSGRAECVFNHPVISPTPNRTFFESKPMMAELNVIACVILFSACYSRLLWRKHANLLSMSFMWTYPWTPVICKAVGIHTYFLNYTYGLKLFTFYRMFAPVALGKTANLSESQCSYLKETSIFTIVTGLSGLESYKPTFSEMLGLELTADATYFWHPLWYVCYYVGHIWVLQRTESGRSMLRRASHL